MSDITEEQKATFEEQRTLPLEAVQDTLDTLHAGQTPPEELINRLQFSLTNVDFPTGTSGEFDKQTQTALADWLLLHSEAITDPELRGTAQDFVHNQLNTGNITLDEGCELGASEYPSVVCSGPGITAGTGGIER